MDVTRRRCLRTVLLLAALSAAVMLPTAAAQPSSQKGPSTTLDRTATHVAGGFTFAPGKRLVRSPIPPSPGVTFLEQDLEPEIKTDIYGNVYVTAIRGVPGGVDLWKSIDKGANFTYLGQPDGAQDKCPTPTVPLCPAAGGGDDSIDVSTGGYLYVSSLWLGNTTMSVSMDGGTGGAAPGQAWTVNPASGGIPPNDRQWIAAYGPQTVYMTWDQAPAPGPLWFTKSTDAGKTFSPPQMLTPVQGVGRPGNLVVDPYNGNIYTTFEPPGAPNTIRFLKSSDGGATWKTSTAYAGPAGTTVQNAFTILAVDRGGNVHLVFSRCTLTGSARSNCHVYLTSSTDAQNTAPAAPDPTWLDLVRVDTGPVGGGGSAVMPWIAAGSPGIVNVTWLQSDSPTPDVNSTWGVFYAQTRDALAANPTFNEVPVLDQPVHDKAICFNGTGCATGTRDLAEYYTMTLDPDGNANIAYEDSIHECTASNCVAYSWYTKQTSGAGSYVPVAGPGASTFSANLALPSSTGDAEPNVWVDSHGCLYAAAPGDPDTWYSEDNGVTWTNVILPTLPTGGGDEHTVTIPKADGSRPDPVYVADLALADVSVRKSTDGGHTFFSPGPGGTAGELDASSDRQWIAGDRVNGGADQVLYEMDHELASELIRFSASVNDSPWSPPTSGMVDPELQTTIPNTNPGPVFVDKTNHNVHGFFTAAIPTTNVQPPGPPFGKMPNVWEAKGPAATVAGSPPGPMVNRPVFKGVIDSPSTAPAGATTIGVSAANDFPSAAADAAGNIYAVWAMNNARTNQYAVWFAASHDHGENFYGPFQISSGPGSAEMPWIAGGSAGRVDIVYYQTDEPGNPNSTNLHWNTMFAQSLNATAREPGFSISQVSDHIMHFGPICNQGLLCPSGTRVLLDFFQVAISTDGKAHITFADTGNANSPSHVTYAKQVTGPPALTTQVPPACVTPPTAASVTSFGATRRAGRTVEVTWNAAANPATLGFNVWRSAARAGRFARLTPRLIPAKSLLAASGHRYRYVDRRALPRTAFYKLQVVGVDGKTRWVGPVAATSRRARGTQGMPGSTLSVFSAATFSSATRYASSPALWLLATTRRTSA